MNIRVITSISAALFYAVLSSAQTPTKAIIYQAYTGENVLNPDLVVAQRYTGVCLVRSLANPARTDAWRCQASNMILDPCFEDGTSLACVVSPWANKASILELNQPLSKKIPLKIDTNTAQPWALLLENGQRCVFLTGASTVLNNQRVNYSCDDYRYSILGNVDRSSPNWKVSLYNFDSKEVNIVNITTAWF